MTTQSLLRTRWAAVGAAVAVTLGAVGIGSLNIANADVSTGDRPIFVSINPCRLVDTRPGDNNVGPKTSPLGPQETFTATAHGSNGECTGPSAIPTDALSLSLNVTAVGPTANTFLTFWGDGTNPGTSNLNPRAGGAPTPNSVNTPLSPAGTFNIFNNRGNVNVIVDVNGYYANHNHDDRYYTETEADARYYTETEVDAAITAAVEAAVAIDKLVLGGRDFDTDSGETEWSLSGTWNRDAGPNECIRSGFHQEAGRTISNVSIRHVGDAADVGVFLAGSTGRTGEWTGSDDIVHVVTSATTSVPATAASTVVETSIALESDLVIREDFHYALNICSSDEINIVSGVIEFD